MDDNFSGDLNVDLQQKLDAIYNTMLNGLLLHRQMRIIDVNPMMCQICGYSKEEILQRQFDSIFIPHESLFGSSKEHSKPFLYRTTCFHENGKKIPVEINVLYAQDSDMYVSIVRDLQEKRDIENLLQAERQQRLKAIFDGQEMERKRVAKEIHDGLAQSLIAINMLIEGRIANSSDIDKDALEKIRLLINAAISDARMMSNNLHPSVLKEFGFITALRQLCDHVRMNGKIQVNFQAECSKFALNTTQSSYLFRIAQEAINNIIRHAHADKIDVVVSQTNNELCLHITDNGVGISENKNEIRTGNGLFNIRERVQLMKGKVDIDSVKNQGTSIIVIIPNWRHITDNF